MTALVMASAALAHSGVKNAAVKARMDAMSEIGRNTKVIGQMAKGQDTFDAAIVRTAAATIAQYAAQVPALFEANETDPKSEALPAIWDNYDDFVLKAEALEQVALKLSSTDPTLGDLGKAMAALGGTCKACHALYRQWPLGRCLFSLTNRGVNQCIKDALL